MFDWEKLSSASEKARKLWNSWPVAVLLILGGSIATVWLARSAPLPGVAIGVLGATAAIMSLRPEMSTPEKVGWILIVTILLRTEVHAIRDDRASAIKQALADRKKQDDDFAEVLREQHNDFSATATSLTQAYAADQQHFDTTVAKLNNASQQVQKTIEQTRPVASVQVRGADVGVDFNLVPMRVGFMYRNDGSDTARTIFIMVKRYIASADASIAQKTISPRFEKSWIDHLKTQKPGELITPGDSKFLTSNFDPYSSTDLSGLKDGSLQTYIVYRIQFSDKTGTWWSDFCDRTLSLGAPSRGCGFYGEARYPAKNFRK